MILFVIISTLFQGNSKIVLRASSISTSITYICSNCFIDNVKVNFYYDIGAYYVCMYVCSIFYGTMNGGTVSCRNVNVSNAVNDVISWNVIGIRFQDKKCEWTRSIRTKTILECSYKRQKRYIFRNRERNDQIP